MSNQYPYVHTQSLGRALRSTGVDSLESLGTIRKKFLFDFESRDVTSYRTIKILKTRETHYAEYYKDRAGPLPKETYWKKHNGAPTLRDSYMARNIIRVNEDGTYEYTKNRKTGEERKLTDQETVWFLLNV